MKVIYGTWIVANQGICLVTILYSRASQKTDGGFVRFGYNSKVKIMGIGEVGTPDTTFIKKVLYVNGLQHNLLSISQLCDEGHNVKFEHDRCYISSSSFEPILSAHRKINVYVTDFQSLTKQNVNCLVAI